MCLQFNEGELHCIIHMVTIGGNNVFVFIWTLNMGGGMLRTVEFDPTISTFKAGKHMSVMHFPAWFSHSFCQ